MSCEHDINEGRQCQRRGEGYTYSLTTINWDADISDTDPIVITRLGDGTDVTSSFTTTAITTYSGNKITLPEITIPTTAQLGDYRVDVPFSAGGFSPGIPYFILRVEV